MRVCIVVGARPQLIKAAELIHGGSRDELDYTLVETEVDDSKAGLKESQKFEAGTGGSTYQTSHGVQSPNIVAVGGDVNTNFDNSSRARSRGVGVGGDNLGVVLTGRAKGDISVTRSATSGDPATEKKSTLERRLTT